VTLAGSLKLDEKAFQECLKAEGSVARVKQDLDDGTASGIGGTPGVIIRNNKTGEVLLLSGAVPLEVLEGKVKELQK
jgi:protein-disulfide isomerase